MKLKDETGFLNLTPRERKAYLGLNGIALESIRKSLRRKPSIPAISMAINNHPRLIKLLVRIANILYSKQKRDDK
ncbi:MAG: hypothetical protein WC998_07570 [Candidatus Paceibacterota bacterium]